MRASTSMKRASGAQWRAPLVEDFVGTGRCIFPRLLPCHPGRAPQREPGTRATNRGPYSPALGPGYCASRNSGMTRRADRAYGAVALISLDSGLARFETRPNQASLMSRIPDFTKVTL